MTKFKLSESFIQKYRDTEPPFGAIGYITYKSKYARPIPEEDRTEEWWETILRVVEGTYNIQKTHCESLRLPWNGVKAQHSAQEMYDLMFNMKFLPPGRGLWMMGTEAVEKRGSASLNNPLHGDTLILTEKDGWVPISSKAGEKVKVLSSTKLYGRDHESTNAAPVWTEADISNFETHDCLKIITKDKAGVLTSTIASLNHRWLRKKTVKKKWERVTTPDLRIGDYLPITRPAKNYPVSLFGAQHGFFFGDGTRSNGELHQFGDSTETLRSLFGDKAISVTCRRDDEWVVRNCPKIQWSRVPELENGRSYLYGFLAGYFAADGSVGKNGVCSISSARLDELKEVKKLFKYLGIRTREIRLSSQSSNFSEERELYQLAIYKNDLDEGFFLQKKHLSRWKENYQKNSNDFAKVVEISLAGKHSVYCATVPNYEQFVIDGFILTSNCSFISTKDIALDFADPFCFLMDMSMLGVGVGGDTKGAGSFKVKEPRQGSYTFTVEDTREGWVELIRTYIDAFAGKGSIPYEVDYSKIRPKGAPIKTFGGTSSGPEPLKQLVEDIKNILYPLVEDSISSEAIVDLFNAIGRCVVSGNVRRSATIMLGDPDDNSFLELKDPVKNKERISKWGWASNNSIYATVGMNYDNVADRTAKNGEPGYFWLDNARKYGRMCDPPNYKDTLVEGCNPCSEQSLESYELCCLVETFPAAHENFDEYKRTLKFAYLYAKTVTLLPTHNARTNAVMLRNRRIGTSQSGIVQSFKKHGIRSHFELSNSGYDFLRDLDRIYSRWLCIPESIKITSVKPSGTVSLLCGATPGVHFPVSEYYWRTQRFDSDSPFVKSFREAGYRIEEGEGYSTVVVYFPVKEENFYKSKEEVTMWEQLEICAQMQYWWADNQVSVTVSFRPEEAAQIPLALQLYETRLKSVSFLPLLTTEDMRKKGYKHPPYQPISKEEYESAVQELKPVNLRQEKTSDGDKKEFCDSDSCTLPR